MGRIHAWQHTLQRTFAFSLRSPLYLNYSVIQMKEKERKGEKGRERRRGREGKEKRSDYHTLEVALEFIQSNGGVQIKQCPGNTFVVEKHHRIRSLN